MCVKRKSETFTWSIKNLLDRWNITKFTFSLVWRLPMATGTPQNNGSLYTKEKVNLVILQVNVSDLTIHTQVICFQVTWNFLESFQLSECL